MQVVTPQSWNPVLQSGLSGNVNPPIRLQLRHRLIYTTKWEEEHNRDIERNHRTDKEHNIIFFMFVFWHYLVSSPACIFYNQTFCPKSSNTKSLFTWHPYDSLTSVCYLQDFVQWVASGGWECQYLLQPSAFSAGTDNAWVNNGSH